MVKVTFTNYSRADQYDRCANNGNYGYNQKTHEYHFHYHRVYQFAARLRVQETTLRFPCACGHNSRLAAFRQAEDIAAASTRLWSQVFFLTEKSRDPSSRFLPCAVRKQKHRCAFHRLKIASSCDFFYVCGPERTRTACLVNANDALYQMSYGPLTRNDIIAGSAAIDVSALYMHQQKISTAARGTSHLPATHTLRNISNPKEHATSLHDSAPHYVLENVYVDRL